MKIVILGAGLLGVASAWFLRRDGHEVTVLERQPDAALETSFANGSQISVSYAEPWANPAAPAKILQWLGQEDAPLLFRMRADWQQWRWGLQFLRECTAGRTRFNTVQLTRLGLYSRATLQALRQELGLDYQQITRGILHLYATEKDLANAAAGIELMHANGCKLDLLTPAQARALEPALANYHGALAGAAYAPEDESGDARIFAQKLAQHAQAAGVEFCYNTRIVRLEQHHHRLTGVQVENASGRRRIDADAYVVCLGSWSAPLLRQIGVNLNIYPAKGYSATFAIKPGQLANTISLTDHHSKIVVSRLGERVRMAGTAEFNGYGLDLTPQRCRLLLQRAEELFPGVLDTQNAELWTGLRPATPSNLPYIGRCLQNVWLNTGHGTLGWTMSSGSGRALADLMAGRKPEVDFRFCGV